ncbi:hypothetical protein N658DRAFT_526303 [Parathielavia hyrcaniae]|uniref:Uncharacterized protein n=1 Tax=Parathielavia hyrcaniae TaxID=113614 RepID=A0AAN6PYH7_9PEZI|nr:hypothetical protein N658DRAFT_526303 [Parathielavia hyrcaniae]
MGNLFSKEKCRSGRGRTPPSEKFTPSKYPYQPMQPPPISRPNQLPPQPGPIHGAYHHPQCRIDPRDDLYYQRPQFSAPVVTNRYPPTASNRPPTSTSFSSSTTLRPSNDSVNPPPRGKPPAPPSSSSIEATRPPKASKAAKGRFARFKPKDSECYAIQLHCTECARQGNSCPITPDLNLPPYTGDSQRDRRSQWWQVPSQRWEVHMDLCSREAIANNRGEDKKKALLGLNRAMGAYGTDEERGKAKRLFCKSELDELEQQLRRGGVKFESYYFKSGETQPTYLP